MSINKRIIVGVVAALTLGVSSCRKFLDVNQNPNIAQSATMKTLLPAAQLYLASSVGVDLQINGSIWAGYWTQSPNASQYRILEQYNPGQDVFSNAWENLYAANENFFQLGKLADSFKNKPYKAISLLMRAYSFQLLTDGWGDIPFTQALKGQSVDSGIISPKYDSQRVVYMGIVRYIDSAITLINTTTYNSVDKDDLVYGGDLSKWLAFGNTLKLKVLLRLSQRDPAYAQTQINNLFTSGATFIDDNTGNAQIAFGFSTTNRSPLYAEIAGLNFVQNLAGSRTCIDSLNANGDDRAYAFYSPNSGGTISGIAQGDYGTVVAQTSYSLPSELVGGNSLIAASANAPVKFMTATESNFLRAEVAARGWATTDFDDSTYFYQGIKASFDDYSVGDASYYNYRTIGGGTAPAYWSVYPMGGSLTNKLRFIITQKWFAMCGNQGFEAWTELRRTGYPDFFVRSKNSQKGAELPVRFLYPTSESTRNQNYPGFKAVTLPVWWDL